MNLTLDIDPHAVCRICLSQKSPTTNLVNFFSNTVVEGYIISVPDMVQKCLEIESSVDDGLPDKICDVCKKEITNFHLFREKSARTEQILLTTFNKSISRKDKKIPPQTSAVGIQTMTEPSFTCFECKMIFKTENLLSRHIINRHYTKTEAGTQTDVENVIAEDNFIEEFQEPMEFNYKREMKMEILEVGDIELEEMNPDMDEVTSEQKSDSQPEYEIVDKVQDEYQCNDCLEIFPGADYFQNHKCPNKVIVHVVNETANTMESDDLSENYYEELIHEVEVYECYRCHATFNKSEDLSIHRNDCKQNDSLLKVQGQRLKMDDDHHCNLCHKRFKTTATFSQHQKLHESIEIVIDYLDCSPCEDCQKIFLSKNQQLAHDCPKKRKNSDGDFIDESCTDYQYLEQESEFTCDVCSMEFSNLSAAKQHVVTHGKQFICPFEGCGCSYEIWSRFAMHLSTKHLNAKRHQCRFCEYICESFDSLQVHYKEECPEKKFKCGHCDKSYFSQKALNLHIKDITKGKTFVCTYCDKSFNRRGELDLHNRSHTNERPYKCTICGKAYKTSSMRAAHMDAHIEGKTFPCTMCDKKLQTRTSYRNHMKRHTEEKKHQCEHCGKKFFTKFHVKLHASKIHTRTKTKPLKTASNILQIDYEGIGESMDVDHMVSTY